MSSEFADLSVTVRNQEVYERSFKTWDKDNKDADADFKYALYGSWETDYYGILALSYCNLGKETNHINVLAGQDVFIKATVRGKVGYDNAVMYIDWDGNGAFDDHDTDLYNLYNLSHSARMEYNLNGVDAWKGPAIRPEWTVRVPETINSPRDVRVRIRVNEGIEQNFVNRAGNIKHTDNIVGATTPPSGSKGFHQYFYSSNLFMFMPSGALLNGQTIDFTMHVEPDTYSPMQPTDASTTTLIDGVGNISCERTHESATKIGLEDETALLNWLRSDSRADTAFLERSMTISATAFTSEMNSGLLDGNGYTITITGTSVTINNAQTDDLFFPYGLTAASLAANMQSYNFNTNTFDKTDYPEYTIAGGLFGKLGSGATIRNLNLKFTGSTTYTGSNNMLFGLVAGVVRGRIENVKVELGGTVTVKSAVHDRPWAVGGFAGVLYRGVIKGCEFDMNGNALTVAPESSLCGESCLGGFIGRLQGGIVSNVKFSGESDAALELTANGSQTYTRYYIGGVAGMTNNPKGIFCGNTEERQLYWGYDNGSTGLDVNNVILNYQGDMNMINGSSGFENYYCRGLLFGETTDTVTVPVVVAQGAGAFKIEEDANTGNLISGNAIPFTSRTKGPKIDQPQNTVTRVYVGKLYLGRDGRIPANSGKSNKYTTINVAGTELNWGLTAEYVEKATQAAPDDKRITCITYAQPYIIATSTNTAHKSIENASANVTLGGDELSSGKAYARIDLDPENATSASWTWSEDEPEVKSDITEA